MKSMELGRLCGCHQMPERSFRIAEYQFPLCARCTGLLLGQLAALLCPALRRIPVRLSAALLLPLVLDGGTQLLRLQKSTNPRRLVTGVLGGIGCLALFCAVFHRLTKHE